MSLKKYLLCTSLSAALCMSLTPQELSAAVETTNLSNPKDEKVEERQPVIQIAILLDNSGSMSGLINQARTQIWALVNEFITAKQGGKRPQLQVALCTYGDPPPNMLLKLSNDLDQVSESLFAISISGGSEHCGQVISFATKELEWSTHRDDLKMIFIAGNEPFSQGPVDYKKACADAISRGIIVNTIHCGNGIPDDWREGAQLADGKAMSINQNQAEVAIATPYDKKISELSVNLNKTYLAYGTDGKKRAEVQMEQDSNAAKASPSSSVQRAVAKSNGYYQNDNWDLVDATDKDFKVLDEIKNEQLPEALKELTREEQEKTINDLRTERSRIQAEINDLNKQRQAFIIKERKNQSPKDKNLSEVMKDAVREQAVQKDFSFE